MDKASEYFEGALLVCSVQCLTGTAIGLLGRLYGQCMCIAMFDDHWFAWQVVCEV